MADYDPQVLRRLVDRIRGAWAGIATVFALALAVLGPVWLNNLSLIWYWVALVGIWLGVTVVGVTARELRVRRYASSRVPRLDATEERYHQLLKEELARAALDGKEPWWKDRGSEVEDSWVDNSFVFWSRREGYPAGRVEILCDQPKLTGEHFAGLSPEAVEPQQPQRSKATLVSASQLLSDEETVLHCAPHDYELAHLVELDFDSFIRANPKASLFGVDGWTPVPGNLCVHALVETADGFVLFSLRGREVGIMRERFSTSFEENVEVGEAVPGAKGSDHTLLDTLLRGLRQELGEFAWSLGVRRATFVSLAREIDKDSDVGLTAAGCTAFVIAELNASLIDLWKSISDHFQVPDRAEHIGWMACRLDTRRQVETLIKQIRPYPSRGVGPAIISDLLGISVVMHPHSLPEIDRSGGFGWHPSSRARLAYWADLKFR